MARMRFEQRTHKWQLWSRGHLVCQSTDRDKVLIYAETHDYEFGTKDEDGDDMVRALLDELR